ncbi:AP-4-A phosphorylase [bioreactor metagenome]
MQPHGFNIGMNLGKVAGAGIDQHLHMHVVPRWNGDTNFMPVIGEVRVVSESLASAYSRLKAIWPTIG